MAEFDRDQALTILLEKTNQGRVKWQESPVPTSFQCSLEEKYFISVSKHKDGYALNMTDQEPNMLFSIAVAKEVFYADPADELRFNKLHALYNLARRMALNIDKKMAEASDLLEKI